MALILSNSRVDEIVRQAMRERAPAMYYELQAAGELEAVVADRVREYDEQMDEEMNRALDLISSTHDPSKIEDAIKTADANLRAASDLALSQALEFPESAALPSLTE